MHICGHIELDSSAKVTSELDRSHSPLYRVLQRCQIEAHSSVKHNKLYNPQTDLISMQLTAKPEFLDATSSSYALVDCLQIPWDSFMSHQPIGEVGPLMSEGKASKRRGECLILLMISMENREKLGNVLTNL